MPSSTHAPDPTWSRLRALPATAVDEELVMIDIDAGAYLALNPVATRIWDLLESPRTLAEICDLLGREFDVDAETCRREVEAFLRDMAEKRLVAAG